MPQVVGGFSHEAARPRTGVRLYFLDDRGVLLDELAQRLYALNPSATLIWCDLTERLEPDEIVSRLERRTELTHEHAAEQVAAILDRWRNLGLLEGGEPPSVTIRRTPRTAPIGRVRATAKPVVACDYRLLDSHIRLSFADPALRDRVDPFLAQMEERHPPGESPTELLLAPLGQGCALREGDALLRCCHTAEEIVPMLKLALAERALAEAEAACAVHAALLRRGGHGLLLAGRSGSGKSTLAAVLGGAGFAALGDDTAVLDHDDLAARALGFGICLKSGAWPVFATRIPRLVELPVHRRPDDRVVRYLPTAAAPRAGTATPVRWLLFPSYRPGAEPMLVPLAPAEALQRLMDGFVPLRERLSAALVERLIAWIGGLHSAALVHDDLDTAVQSIDDFCRT